MNNTRFSYLYRDATNCKKHRSEILSGSLTLRDIEPYLDETIYFIPSQVGLEDLQHLWKLAGFPLSLDHDHPWHEILDIAPTDESPTIPVSTGELVRAFTAAQWDEAAAMTSLGLAP